MKNKILIIIILSQFSLIAAIPDSIQKDITWQLEKYKTLLDFSYQYHKDSLDLDAKADAAFNAYLQSLDSKSVYYTADQYTSMKTANTGVIKSIGITQLVFADTSYVFQVQKNSSADSNGVIPGWRLLSVNSESLIGKDEATIKDKLSDTTIRNFELEMLTHKGEKVTKTLVNSAHITSSIDLSFMINDTIGYIKSLKFTENAGDEYKDVISNFPKQIKGLVIDLRDNPGGVLTAISKVISLFIKEGKQVIKTESKHPDYDYNIKSKEDGPFIGLPLVLIVNEVSASATELFAGAVQDYDLGIVVGQRTYGKGTLQKHWEFKDGSAFRITVGEYVTPLGRKVQKETKSIYDKSMESLDENLNEKLRNMQVPKEVKMVESEQGRKLISIGGIMPDSTTVPNAETTKLTSVAKQKRVFIKTAFEIFLGEFSTLKGKYKTFVDFCKDFNFTDGIYTKINQNLLAASLQNDKMYEQDKSTMARLVKARLGQLLYSDEAYYCTDALDDVEVEKAIISVKDAQSLVKKN